MLQSISHPVGGAIDFALSEKLSASQAQSERLVAEPSTTTLTERREAFDDFVGQTFYGQMLSAMRKTVDKPAYFHGGRAEEVFQAQLDQTLAEHLSDSTAEQFTGPMFELFNLARH